MARPTKRTARGLSAIWITAAAAYVAFIASCTFVIGGSRAVTLFDDAMISMRYARNLVEHGALTWNPGEPHVEGYTNFLWTLWMALVHLLSLPELWIALAIIASGVALLGVTGRQLVALLRHARASHAAVAIALATTLLCYGLAYWTLRGMEVGLLACLLATGTLWLVRLADDGRPRALGWVALCAAAALLTRSDAVVFVVPWIAFAAVALRGRSRLLACGVLVATVVVTLGAHTLFRWAYYGDPLPNTYYLKLGGIPLGSRLVRGIAAAFHLLQVGWFVPFAVAGIAFARPEHRLLKLLLAAQVVAGLAYSIYVGGDAWEQFDIPNRYISPAVPALFALAALGIDVIARSAALARVLALALLVFAGLQLVMPFMPATSQTVPAGDGTIHLRIAVAVGFALHLVRRQPPARWLVGVLLLLATSGERWVDWARHGAADVAIDASRVRHGLAIRAATTPDATLATTPAGNIPYFAERRTIDLLGKSDAHVAHEPPRTARFHPGHVKWDYPYSIGQLQPDLIDELYTPHEAWLVDADKRALPGWGYVELGSNVYVHAGSPRVDATSLRAALESRH